MQLLLPQISGRPLHSPIVVEERRELIRSRIHIISIASAILIIAWIPVDLSAFSQEICSKLIVARIIIGNAFLLLAYVTRGGTKTSFLSWQPALMFFIPTLFVGYCQVSLGSVTQYEARSEFIFTTYALIPFIVK